MADHLMDEIDDDAEGTTAVEEKLEEKLEVEPEDAEVVDSPTDWVARHIRTYVETKGRDGHLFHGVPTLLLTTRGRRSGVRRRTALIYGEAGDTYLVVASNAGSAQHPGWYLNLEQDPAVDVQVGGELFPAWARIATPAEKPLLWQQMAAIFPTYLQYQERTERDIPVVMLERA